MENELSVNFTTVGFKPSELRPRKMWNTFKEEFVMMYNDYCEITNAVIPELNKAWEANHPTPEEEDSKELTEEEVKVKDLQDQLQNWEYAAFMRDAFDQATFMVNSKHEDSYLSSFVFMDGPNPVFGARIKQHPEMVISIAIESK